MATTKAATDRRTRVDTTRIRKPAITIGTGSTAHVDTKRPRRIVLTHLSSEESEHLVCKYEVAAKGLNASEYVETLLIRDHIQALLTEQLLSSEQINRIYNADIMLRDEARSLDRAAVFNRDLFQQTILPPAAHWWWQPIEEPQFWNIISVAALAITGALATQFTARILSKNPDAWGVSAVVLQGALTLLAGGAFTVAGKRLFKKIGLGRITVQARAYLATIQL